MQIVNDYGKDVCNGDTGQVADVDPDNRRADRAVPRTGTRLRLRADAGLCRDGAQEPGLGVSGRRHPDAHPALRDAAAEPALHRGDSRQAPGGARRAVRNAAGRRRWSRLDEWLRNLAGQRRRPGDGPTAWPAFEILPQPEPRPEADAVRPAGPLRHHGPPRPGRDQIDKTDTERLHERDHGRDQPPGRRQARRADLSRHQEGKEQLRVRLPAQ